MGSRIVYVNTNEKLADILLKNEIVLNSDCGGTGKCGKCAVRVTSGAAKITSADRACFSPEQLKDGYRLACRFSPKTPCTVECFSANDENYEILTDFRHEGEADNNTADGFGVAVDLGTTTIAMALVATSSGECLSRFSCVNSQRRFGADVLSRISAANVGNSDALRQCAARDIISGVRTLSDKAKIPVQKISKIVVSGNTVMLHLLRGLSCKGLGVYPFAPVDISATVMSARELFGGDELDAQAILFPSFSAFVGGDIVSGLYGCGAYESDETVMLVDVGTNGEIAVGGKNGFTVTSVAAGPAFEGGSISCGVPCVRGAVSAVGSAGGVLTVETVGNGEPVGICGSGVIDLTAEMLKLEVADRTGKLSDEYFENGFPFFTNGDKTLTFTQNDLRQVQLAKAAVFAGISVLLNRSGCGSDSISKMYLSGGFGNRINLEKAVQIGLFPSELAAKTEFIGNSSLAGAVRLLCRPSDIEAVSRLAENAKEIPLSTDDEFNSLFINSMLF